MTSPALKQTQAPALVLFDIDGTLVSKAGPAHRRALEAAVHEVAGVQGSLEGVSTHGRLDQDLILELLGVEGHHDALPQIYLRAEEIYLETCPDIRDRVCPGVPELLHHLRQAHVPLGLVTGNLSRIAWTKLERAGLRDDFSFGAFSGMAPTRSQLVALAVTQARAERLVADDALISLVGDHHHDMHAAKTNGIRAIGVATGALSVDQLRASGADLAVETLSHLSWKYLLQIP
jgi:phosphoglycolate phosphatase